MLVGTVLPTALVLHPLVHQVERNQREACRYADYRFGNFSARCNFRSIVRMWKRKLPDNEQTDSEHKDPRRNHAVVPPVAMNQRR